MRTQEQVVAAWEAYLASLRMDIRRQGGGQVLQVNDRGNINRIQQVGASSRRSLRQR